MNATTDQYALSWSHAQNALHVEPLAECLRKNGDACAANRGGDYRVLFIGARQEVERAADAIRTQVIGRRVVRNAA